MTKETFERAKKILLDIEYAEKSIETFERICEVGKGEMVICTKEKMNGGHNNVSAIYLSGDTFNAVRDAYIGYWEAQRDEKQRELEAL